MTVTVSHRRFAGLSLLALALGSAVPAHAQDTKPAMVSPAAESAAPQDVASDDTPVRNGEIVVTAARIRGQVDVPQPPVATYDEKDLGALGASSLTDVLARISPQTSSGRGRGSGQPYILVNGQRITDFREMRNYPPEALRRVEVLPEEVALRYGFPPDARVVNFILKDNFISKRAEMEYGFPTRGGFATGQLQASTLAISGPRRFNLAVELDRTTSLLESERPLSPAGLQPTVAGDAKPGQFRTLIPASSDARLTASWSTGLGQDGKGGTLSLNGQLQRSTSDALSGLNVVALSGPLGSAVRSLPDPLERETRGFTAQGGAGLNLPLGSWQMTATLNATHNESVTRFDRRADLTGLIASAASGTLNPGGALPFVADPGQDKTTTYADSGTSLITLVGRPVRLPAGDVSVTLKGGYAYSGVESYDTRSTTGVTRLSRGDLSAGINLGVPLTSRRENFGAGIGDLTLNLSAGWNRLSDFGNLLDWSAGLSWSPLEELSLQASYIVNESAPSLGDLGNPRTVTFNVPVYDFARNQTVLASVIGGGNPSLRQERQRDVKLSANWQLPILANSSVVVEYFRNRSQDVTAPLPLLTPAIEAAFPGRAVRDPSGALISVDRRPVTLAEQNSQRVRYGFNVSGTVGKADAATAGEMPGMGGRRGAGPRMGGGRGGMMAMMGGAGGQGRWMVGVFHTIQFDNTVLIAPGGPLLDLLAGDALNGGGVARHALDWNGGVFYKGFGMFMNGSWATPTRLRSSAGLGGSDLRFGSVTKVNLNLFADLGQRQALVKAAPFFKGARLSLKVDNLLDARQRVTDASGLVPLSYQPDYIDPRGRVITLEFRKTF